MSDHSHHSHPSHHVDIHAPTVRSGLAEWDTTTTHLAMAWQEGTRRIRTLTESAPWGDDTAGTAFLAAYQSDGGTDLMIKDGEKIIEDIAELGGKVRSAVSRSRRTDGQQARSIQGI